MLFRLLRLLRLSDFSDFSGFSDFLDFSDFSDYSISSLKFRFLLKQFSTVYLCSILYSALFISNIFTPLYRLKDAGHPFIKEAAMGKLMASEAATWCAHQVSPYTMSHVGRGRLNSRVKVSHLVLIENENSLFWLTSHKSHNRKSL